MFGDYTTLFGRLFQWLLNWRLRQLLHRFFSTRCLYRYRYLIIVALCCLMDLEGKSWKSKMDTGFKIVSLKLRKNFYQFITWSSGCLFSLGLICTNGGHFCRYALMFIRNCGITPPLILFNCIFWLKVKGKYCCTWCNNITDIIPPKCSRFYYRHVLPWQLTFLECIRLKSSKIVL